MIYRKRHCTVITDWFTSGIGFVILQQHCTCNTHDDPYCCTGGWKLILCGCRCLQGTDHNYAAIEGEALAIVWCFTLSKISVIQLSSVYCFNKSQAVINKHIFK